jgi:hypothetical protein
MRRLIVGVASAATLASGVAIATSASAAPLLCDQDITASVTLTQNYTCGSSSFLHVRAPDVVINFAGHSVHGLGGDFHGIDLEGNSHATVMNGAIDGFLQDGVNADDTVKATITNMNIFNIGEDGVDLGGARYANVSNNKITKAVTGIRVEDGTYRDHNTINNNTLTKNVTGLLFGWQSAGVVTNNKGIVNEVGFLLQGDDSGSLITKNSDLGSGVGFKTADNGNDDTLLGQTGPVVQENAALGSVVGFLDGPSDPGPYTTFKKNVATQNVTGIQLKSAYAQVLTNAVSKVMAEGTGIYGDDDAYSLIKWNAVSSANALVTGIHLRSAFGDVVAQNTSKNTGTDSVGILMDVCSGYSQLSTNVTNGNGLDGMVVSADSYLNTITNNVSNNNGRYGFNVPPADLLLGGNLAFGNLTNFLP